MRTTWHLELLMVTKIKRDVRMGGFTPGDFIGDNVPSCSILGSSVRLVSWADCCSEAGSVVCQGFGIFPGPGGVWGWGLYCRLSNGRVLVCVVSTALSGMYRALGVLFAFLHDYLVALRKGMSPVSCVSFQSDFMQTKTQ